MVLIKLRNFLFLNYQDVLKTIAIISMIIDHIGSYFYPEVLILKIIGRLAMPIFSFFAGYNFKGKIRFQLLQYGIILQILQVFVFNYCFCANILISIFLGQLYIFFFNLPNPKSNSLHLSILILLIPLCIIIDYGSIPSIFILLGRKYKMNPKNIFQYSSGIVLLTILINQILFQFNGVYFILFISCMLFLFFLFVAYDFTKSISCHYFIISRYSLIIYYLHLGSFYIWKIVKNVI